MQRRTLALLALLPAAGFAYWGSKQIARTIVPDYTAGFFPLCEDIFARVDKIIENNIGRPHQAYYQSCELVLSYIQTNQIDDFRVSMNQSNRLIMEVLLKRRDLSNMKIFNLIG